MAIKCPFWARAGKKYNLSLSQIREFDRWIMNFINKFDQIEMLYSEMSEDDFLLVDIIQDEIDPDVWTAGIISTRGIKGAGLKK